MTTATIKTQDTRRKTQDLYCRRITADIDISCLSEVISKLPQPAILGGNSSVEGFSYWMANPVEVFEFRVGQTEPFEKLHKILNKYITPKAQLPQRMFTGGWVGFFSYDLGRYIEPSAYIESRVAQDDLSLPLIRLCFYDRLIAYDHRKGDFWLIALQPADGVKLNELEELLAVARNVKTPLPYDGKIEDVDFTNLRCNMSRGDYFKALDKIKRHIYDGNVYQINFSQRFENEYHARPIDLFHWQGCYNPSPFAAYIDAGDFQIVSASPEMFITTNNRIISTKPIKGTRRRFDDTSPEAKNLNAENLKQLINSAKEKAELNMIIDLERNDVARLCKPGTRIVSQPRTIETCPTVFHAVATVAGQLRDTIDFCDILKAMFPGGSITGAPKIRSMQIIDQIEPTARGIYTGSIGCIGIDGNSCLNIAIRTIIIKNNLAYVQTGGGIVADSDPQAEYDETLIKARALIAGIKNIAHCA